MPLIYRPAMTRSDAEDYGWGRAGGLYPQRSGAKRARSED
jgi:hypothetical protein